MSLTSWERYEKPDETLAKIKHAIKLAATRLWSPLMELLEDDLKPLISIEDIQDGQCRWPIEQMHWCGRPSGDNVYCEVHDARSKPQAHA